MRVAGARGHAVAAVVLAAACTSQPAPAQNIASTASPRLAIAPDQPLGWIGIAPRPARDPGDWIPAAAHAVLVPLPAERLTVGATLSAIDTAGLVARVTAAAASKVPYGCDQNQLDVLAFTGDRLAPGVVWLLPPGAPAIWKPRPVGIASRVVATASRRRDIVGPFVLELERSDAAHATLTIARDGRVLHTSPVTRGEMAGADPGPMDLRLPGVAIPEPVAAWSFVDGGPVLLVCRVPSYEGVNLTAFLLESDRAREVPAMAAYLYRCAF